MGIGKSLGKCPKTGMSEASVAGMAEEMKSGKEGARRKCAMEERWCRTLWATVRTSAFTLDVQQE